MFFNPSFLFISTANGFVHMGFWHDPRRKINDLLDGPFKEILDHIFLSVIKGND